MLTATLKRLCTPVLVRLKDTLSDRRTLASMILLVSIVTLSATGGYLVGQESMVEQQGLVIIPASFSGDDVSSAIPSPQSGQINRSEAVSFADQAETTSQLGHLRAELLRLHSLFVRLAEQAELDDGEFDLQSPLLDWKRVWNK